MLMQVKYADLCALRIWYCVCVPVHGPLSPQFKKHPDPNQNNDRINPGGQQNSREMINPDPVTAA